MIDAKHDTAFGIVEQPWTENYCGLPPAWLEFLTWPAPVTNAHPSPNKCQNDDAADVVGKTAFTELPIRIHTTSALSWPGKQ